jgi:hypothetical protein
MLYALLVCDDKDAALTAKGREERVDGARRVPG